MTTTTNIYNMADTWNAGGTTFDGIKLNISNGAGGAPVGAAASRAFRLQANGTDIFSVSIAGRAFSGNGAFDTPAHSFVSDATLGMYYITTGVVGFGASGTPVFAYDTGAIRISAAVTLGWSTPNAHSAADTTLARESAGFIGSPGSLRVMNATAIPAGGTAGAGYKFSSTANFGVFFGSGAPSLAAAKGSLYLRSDGSGTGDRAYINTDGSTTWTPITTAG